MYLAIGLFVYFRRGNAPRALHFFLLCLASFILFDVPLFREAEHLRQGHLLGNVVAGFLAPTLFLHFCFVFPEPQKWIRRRGAAALLYLPGLALAGDADLGVVVGLAAHRPRRCSKSAGCWTGSGWRSCARCIWPAALVLALQLRHADDPIVRRQLTWLRNGALLGMLPFALFYAVAVRCWASRRSTSMNLAVLSLPLIPLTWAYAILRYRLMDVDIIFQEGYVYTLATLACWGFSTAWFFRSAAPAI